MLALLQDLQPHFVAAFRGFCPLLPPEFQEKVVDCLVRENPPERALARENLRDTCHAGAESRGSRPHELAAHGEGVLLVLDTCRRVHERGAEPVHVIGAALDGHEALAAKPHDV